MPLSCRPRSKGDLFKVISSRTDPVMRSGRTSGVSGRDVVFESPRTPTRALRCTPEFDTAATLPQVSHAFVLIVTLHRSASRRTTT